MAKIEHIIMPQCLEKFKVFNHLETRLRNEHTSQCNHKVSSMRTCHIKDQSDKRLVPKYHNEE